MGNLNISTGHPRNEQEAAIADVLDKINLVSAVQHAEAPATPDMVPEVKGMLDILPAGLHNVVGGGQ